MRYPLVDGQGNFGSVDGDPPAAMRYTEARLQAFAEELMSDLDKETVDFVPNYDETTEEPTVLPAPLPNLLVNGSSGIAVGMATNIPPHNLREVIDGDHLRHRRAAEGEPPHCAGAPRLQHQRRGDRTTTRDERLRHLLRIVTGPDFPTAATSSGGRASSTRSAPAAAPCCCARGTSSSSRRRATRPRSWSREIPYQVNKARLIEKIADLVRDKVIEGISDLRDESDRDGMRIVIEVKRGEMPEVVLNNLYKHTALQTSFGIIMLAIVGGRPRVLNLLEFIEQFIEFRREVVRRRIEFELRKAEARAHILEGLRIALDHLDAVISLIRGSKSTPEARDGLMREFGLSQLQAQAILEMQLQRLTGLERQKILDELAELLKTIEHLRGILASDERLMQLIIEELLAVQTKYSDDRRTEILEAEGELRIEDLIAEEDVAITVSDTGYIKRTAITTYRSQRRGGRGRIGMKTKEEDFVAHLFVASTHDYLMIFSDRGRAYWLKVHEIPEVMAAGKGKAIANLVSMQPHERIAAVLTVRDWEEGKFVVMGTRRGVIKKTALPAFSNPRAGGIIAMGIEEDDAVIAASISDGSGHVLIATRNGMAIRFEEADVRTTGRGTYGVRGIELRDDDVVVAMEVLRDDAAVLTLTENGYGKRTAIDEYRVTGRGGLGIINIQTTGRNGRVVGVACVTETDEVMFITQQGMVLRTPARNVSIIGRNTQGVRLIDMDEGDRAVSVARLEEQETEGGVEDQSASPDGPDPAAGGSSPASTDPIDNE